MRPKKRKRAQSGSVMVEFTLSLSVLIPLFLGTWTYGYSFYRYSELENAVRAGARYASLQKYDSATSTPSSAFLTAVRKMTVYGDPAADPNTATPVVPGLTTGNVRLAVTFTSGAPRGMTVAIDNYTLPSFIGSVTLHNKPSVGFPFLGIFGPP
jgi:Flp pilus assembly protein TadG